MVGGGGSLCAVSKASVHRCFRAFILEAEKGQLNREPGKGEGQAGPSSERHKLQPLRLAQRSQPFQRTRSPTQYQLDSETRGNLRLKIPSWGVKRKNRKEVWGGAAEQTKSL